jgi:hypothetical protein
MALNMKKDTLCTISSSGLVVYVSWQSPLRNPKHDHHVHKNLSLDRILKRLKAGHTFKSYLFKLYFNIVLPSASIFPRWISYYRVKIDIFMNMINIFMSSGGDSFHLFQLLV